MAGSRGETAYRQHIRACKASVEHQRPPGPGGSKVARDCRPLESSAEVIVSRAGEGHEDLTILVVVQNEPLVQSEWRYGIRRRLPAVDRA